MITALFKKFSTSIILNEIIQEAPETYTFKFAAPQNTGWTPGANAHFIANNLQNGQKFTYRLVHEFSIMSHPKEEYLGFTTRIRSIPSLFKQTLKELNSGDQIRIFGIRNNIQLQKVSIPITLISMGVGVATFRPIILDYINSTSQIPFITNINVDRSSNFIYQNELEKSSENRIQNVFVTSRVDLYKSIDKALKKDNNIYYIVGSNVFNRNIKDYLLKNKVPKRLIKFDK